VFVENNAYELLTGGWGLGSYYYSLLLQLLVVYPLLWGMVKEYRFAGLLVIFGVNFVYEWVMTVMGVSETIYRLLILRYVFLIGAGAYLYLYRDGKNIFIEIASICFGILFIVYVKYFGNPVWPLNTMWIGTSFLAALYIIPVYKWLVYSSYQINASWEIIINLGRASYNIFLFQMLFYGFVVKVIYKYILYDWLTFCLCLGICLYGGWKFYCWEGVRTKKLISQIE